MTRSAQTWTEATIERFRREGYGEGSGRDYKPWLTVTAALATEAGAAPRTSRVREHSFHT